MGSFNAQCAVTRETIAVEDKVMSFFLETNESLSSVSKVASVAQSIGDHFVLSSLPVSGKYSDYGNIVPNKNEDDIYNCDYVRQVYGVNFIEHDEDNYQHPSINGLVDSAYDTNTIQWFIRKETFDAMVSSINRRELTAKFKQEPDAVLLNLPIHSTLKNNIKENAKKVVDVMVLTQALQNLGINFECQSSITSQDACNDYKFKKELHVSTKRARKHLTEDNGLVKHVCVVTGDAIGSNDTFYVMPIDDHMNATDRVGTFAHMNTHKTDGMYRCVTGAFKCGYNENGDITLLSEPDKFQKNLALVGLSKEIIADDFGLSLQKMLNEGIEYNAGFHQHYRCAMVLSEYAYDFMMNGSKRDQWDAMYKKEYEVFRDVLVYLKTLHDGNYASFESIPEDILRNDLVYSAQVKDFFHPACESTEEHIRSFKSSALDAIKNIDSDKDKFIKNAFSNMINGNKEKGLTGYSSSLFWRSLSNIFRDKDIETLNKALDTWSYLEHGIRDINMLTSAFNKYGLSFKPSEPYSGGLSVSEQRDLNQSVCDVAVNKTLKKLQENEIEMGY